MPQQLHSSYQRRYRKIRGGNVQWRGQTCVLHFGGEQILLQPCQPLFKRGILGYFAPKHTPLPGHAAIP